MPYTATRLLGIDMGHRVPDHGSKCRNLHGHRYQVEATLMAYALAGSGEETGMVMDFGFLKELMVEHIEKPFDHALCLAWNDPLAHELFGLQPPHDEPEAPWADYQAHGCRVVLIDRVPTAENLAGLWWTLLAPGVAERSAGRAMLERVKVWETPNCWAAYPK